MRKIVFLAGLSLILILPLLAQRPGEKPPNPNALTLARLKYPGGGDWYWGNSALPNLIKFIKENTKINIADEEVVVSVMDENLFNYPFLFMTGHGNVKFSDQETDRLRKYLTSGGFLFANDSYGMDAAFRREMKKIFPENDLKELPFGHKIYHSYFDFPNGLPKIHKHDGKPAQGFGIFDNGRLVVFYAYESDIGDGWEDEQVHNDPPEKREQALKMGVNILTWAIMQ
ncbi:MAG: hypothetical protein A2W09_08195 [Deltaproteobacteria bacterium RBG_16_50_11]|nr:MAG: hypothetical protein A2W09_08195 [Deltaproteobacteria bacterium RBG_16_50_11]